jgi:hypothetical protein
MPFKILGKYKEEMEMTYKEFKAIKEKSQWQPIEGHEALKALLEGKTLRTAGIENRYYRLKQSQTLGSEHILQFKHDHIWRNTNQTPFEASYEIITFKQWEVDTWGEGA